MQRLRRVQVLAGEQGGVVSRQQVYELGLTRGEVQAHLRAERWQWVWSRSLCVHTGEVAVEGRHWAAVFEGGSRAQLDGATSLVASGLRGYEPGSLRVSVPRGVTIVRAPGLDVRQSRRWAAEDRAAAGVPRTRVEIAAVRAALWAATDRQASLLITMPVQQRLTTAESLGRALLEVRRDRRRPLLHALVLDLLDGVRSLGELDFARECRARGLPAPTRQVVRRGRDGSYYLDVYWQEWDLVVEIDGIQHGWVQNAVGDALRHNEVTLQAARVLRLPVLGLRVAPDDFFHQIRRAAAGEGRRDVMAMGGQG